MSFIAGILDLIDLSSFTKECHYAIFKEAARKLFLVAIVAPKAQKEGKDVQAQKR